MKTQHRLISQRNAIDWGLGRIKLPRGMRIRPIHFFLYLFFNRNSYVQQNSMEIFFELDVNNLPHQFLTISPFRAIDTASSAENARRTPHTLAQLPAIHKMCHRVDRQVTGLEHPHTSYSQNALPWCRDDITGGTSGRRRGQHSASERPRTRRATCPNARCFDLRGGGGGRHILEASRQGQHGRCAVSARKRLSRPAHQTKIFAQDYESFVVGIVGVIWWWVNELIG